MPPSFKLATLTLAVNAALITPVAAQAADEDLPSVTLPTITVTAETEIETADGPVQGIAASRVSSTTGFDESILKSTQSVTVVGQQEMETIGTNDMEDALGYVSGITAWQPSDKASTSYVIRGFRNFQNYYQDGQRILANSFDGPFETYGLERVEVIKGPNSLLNGAMPPGGTINNITKKPYFADGYEVNAEIGSFNRKQISADINQKLTDDIAVRLVGVYKNSDSFVNYVPDDAIYIAPSLTWQPSDATQLTLQADYHQINTKYITFLPAVGTLDTQYGKIDRESFVGGPIVGKSRI
ncbi:TonB-dependent siderophore receptor [Psychrobacter pygoscelis]|uniref:TonB-dependent siderophore receptor n=1 Tax=Psychrobacter pygoscelis TaxID=2488563 RepID=UPI00103B756F|nr:TonB-dependent receptor plug domain-containing protein [Psychrobacter pygoscelis]